MNNLKYKGILYFIAAVILATLCIQVYWNYKNYLVGKQQLINDIQTSLDNAVDSYYTDLAKTNSFSLWTDSLNFISNHTFDSVLHKSDTVLFKNSLDIQMTSLPNRISMLRSQYIDSSDVRITIIDSPSYDTSMKRFAIFDSVINPIEMLSSKIIISFTQDTLSLKKLDSLLLYELNRKNISVDYGLSHTGLFNEAQSLRPEVIERSNLSTTANSPYSFFNNSLTIHFSNITFAVLKKNMVGIILSFLLITSVILCLLYLLKIIKHQKQLAEVKNDLINNITHEFKTPIATIGVAMEAILGFNDSRDSEKNLRYAKISQEQVEKLNGMVEKLLETATLDSEQLPLNFEEHDLVDLLEKATTKEVFSDQNKTIIFNPSEEKILYKIDIFHFENAVNNIIDNAIKYGGNEVSVTVKKEKGNIIISISDSGTSLTEHHKKQIFEKFYRVPKGNTHDVKGFGIGLYYAKKIIEKHHGTITLHVNKQTTFIINLPIAPKN